MRESQNILFRDREPLFTLQQILNNYFGLARNQSPFTRIYYDSGCEFSRGRCAQRSHFIARAAIVDSDALSSKVVLYNLFQFLSTARWPPPDAQSIGRKQAVLSISARPVG